MDRWRTEEREEDKKRCGAILLPKAGFFDLSPGFFLRLYRVKATDLSFSNNFLSGGRWKHGGRWRRRLMKGWRSRWKERRRDFLKENYNDGRNGDTGTMQRSRENARDVKGQKTRLIGGKVTETRRNILYDRRMKRKRHKTSKRCSDEMCLD